jgi:tetratricopeptide (TPR) repeat protein
LQDGNIGKWILVLDNVDDDELLRKPLVTRTDAQANTQNHISTQPPLRYLLRASNGSIIITSRNRAVASEIGQKKHLIDVQPMNMAEALDLMQHKLDSCAERADLVQLVEELEFMPLAIVQAASYIAHRSPRCSASEYLEKLRQSDRQATKLLNHEGRDTNRDWEAKNSILLTWQISFDHIRRIRQSAADLLSLMSFFDWQGIPEDLLRVQGRAKTHDALGSLEKVADSSSGEDTESSSESDLDDDFESDIATLRDYSFVATGENNMVFTMHRLVQLTVRTWLKTFSQDEEWKERFINILHAEFPTGQYEHWGRCRTLFPHVRSAVSNRPNSEDCLRNWAGLLYKGAWYAKESGNITESREMAFISRKQRMKILGAEDEETLDSTELLAEAYRLEGRWEEAEQLFVQVIETSKTKLGADHPDTLTSMGNLASTYWNQGRWEEAEQLEVQVMETRKTKLGADHPDTLTSMANLASTYRNQGRWEDAEQLEVQVMETSKTKLRADHPDTLTSMGNLALTYMNQGRWEEAEQLFMQVMATRKTKLGADHPNTLTSMGNLASTYRNQGRWKKAEQLEVQVMKTFKTKLGADHPSTLTSMGNLAVTYMNQGRWEEAEQLGVQVMETRKTKLGADHPDTLTSMGNLASTYMNQGRWEEAEQLFVQVIETRKTKLGADHPSTLTSMGNLAVTYRNQGRWEDAEQLGVQVMETRKTKLGADHPDTLTSMANLAHTLKSSAQDKAALLLMAECV